MITINFIVPSGINSFYYSTVYAAKWLDHTRFRILISNKPIIGAINIRVNDMWREFLRPTRAHVYWLDTPLYYNDIYRAVPLQKIRPRKILVTSKWNQEMCLQYFDDCDILPRLIHPYWFIQKPLPLERKEYDLGFVASCWWRKNCRMFKEICSELKLKCWMSGRYDAISFRELVERVRRTKFIWMVTQSEGFGLPVFEAQAAGTLPICVKAHALVDWCFSGLWVEPIEEKIVNDVSGRHKVWIVDRNDVKHIVKEALSISNEEYNKRAVEVREKTLNITLYASSRLEEIVEEITNG